MRCVKVELAESSGWTFLWRATLNTHRQSSDHSLWCPATATVFSTLLRVCVLRKCEIPGLMGRTMSSQISQVHIFHLYPELNRAFLYYVRPEIIHLFQQQSHFSSVLSGQLFFSVTSTKKQNCPSARSLTNHRCWLRLRVGLPDPSASLVRRTLPMTLHFVPRFDDRRPVSWKVRSGKGWRSMEIYWICLNGISKDFFWKVKYRFGQPQSQTHCWTRHSHVTLSQSLCPNVWRG